MKLKHVIVLQGSGYVGSNFATRSKKLKKQGEMPLPSLGPIPLKM